MLKKVAVVCTYPFPNGLAATTRIIAYMKGLHELGVETDVFVYRPTEIYGKSTGLPIDGTIDGVRYIYPNTRVYSKHKLIRGLGRFYCHAVTCYKILREHRKRKYDFILISNDFLDVLYLYTIWSNLIGSRPVFITDEYPMPIRIYLNDDIPQWKKSLYHIILKHNDSMIFMTQKLCDFFNRKLHKPYHILPTITDTERFNSLPVCINSREYLCYMGNMELSKDNVDNIIRAFAIISEKYPDLDLYLYGAPSIHDRTILENLICQLRMQNRVFIKGRVNPSEVPIILKNAYILVSSQPNTRRAEGGFPTKLGEYMATGVPAILTDVGEIKDYVTDGIHVHIVPPQSPQLYAAKLDWILSNYDIALEIAEVARRYIVSRFDYKPISAALYDFLEGRLMNTLNK